MVTPLLKISLSNTLVALLVSVALTPVVNAQARTATAASAPTVQNSKLDAPLLYQLLIGEIELRSGEVAEAYQIIFDAARRTKDEQLFRRATEIAVQARAGDEALAAVKAWRQAAPESLDALRYQVELLAQMNRQTDSADAAETLLKLTPPAAHPALIYALPRLLMRGNTKDQTLAATLIERILQPYLEQPATRTAALVSTGRGWLVAQEPAKALELAQLAHTQNVSAEGPALLALEMFSFNPATEAIVQGQLATKQASKTVRMAYVRALLSTQRYPEAIAQLNTLTHQAPSMAPAWLTLGALHLEQREPAPAIVALKKYVSLLESPASASTADLGAPDSLEDAAASKEESLTKAYLLLSQAAEMQGNTKAAQAWLAKIDDPQRAQEIQIRRASLLAREGKLAQARELVRRIPEREPGDARAKLLAEAQLLRDAKAWSEANAVLAQANQKFPDDADLIFEQSMMLERLGQLDDMEKLLRRVIELKPDHRQAYNALGYALADRNVRLPEARSLIRKALDLSPGDPAITDSLGWVEYRLGNRAEALRLLRAAYRGQPDAEVGAHLGEVLWVQGQTDEARRVWRESQKRDPANSVLRETLTRLRVTL